MRSLLGILSLLVLACVSQPAAAYEYPWCAHYEARGSYDNCGFVSFEQCRWTIAGLGGYCAQNPFYVAAHAVERPRFKHVRKHRHY